MQRSRPYPSSTRGAPRPAAAARRPLGHAAGRSGTVWRAWVATTLIVLGLLWSWSAHAVEVAGITYEPTVAVAGSKLQLNGAGIRYKAVFKVYTAGLYLGAKAATPEAVLAAPGPKRMHIVMLRDIDANALGKLFTRGMEDNATRDEFYKSVGGIMEMTNIFIAKKKLSAGESFSVDWVPGTGTVILVNGKPVGTPIKEPAFYASLLKIWLGKSPADARLKEVLLGRPVNDATPSPDDPSKF